MKKAVPVQVGSDGPNSLKVTLPVGLKPPERVAVSLRVVPIGPPADGVVPIVGVVLVTVAASAAQGLLTGLLFASPA